MRASTEAVDLHSRVLAPMEIAENSKLQHAASGGFIRAEFTANPRRLKYSIDEILGRSLSNGESTEASEKATPHDRTENAKRKQLTTGGHLSFI